ncbi:MAG: N-acyl-D-amino-acid deacylase family protein [Ignavibacteriaceae bacterium]
MFDLILTNGQIVDGTGKKRYIADIGIKKGKISAIGNFKNVQGSKVIECNNYIVSPGFIDLHSHSDLQIINHKIEKLLQGVTTEVIGNCGFSAFPILSKNFQMTKDFSSPIFGEFKGKWNWKDAKSYFNEIKKNGLVLNVASLVGHGTLRISVMGFSNQPPTSEQLRKMKNKLEKEIDNGAVGFSSGLMYSPGSYSQMEELIELNKVLKGKNKFYASHMRSYSFQVVEAVKEAIDVGRAANVPVQISHLQAAGYANWKKLDTVLELISRAADSDLDIAIDAYPFLAGSTVMTQLLPQWMLEGGIKKMIERINKQKIRIKAEEETQEILDVHWKDLYISSVNSQTNKNLIGKNLAEIAKIRNIKPVKVVFDLLIEEKGKVMIISFNQPERNLIKVLRYPKTMIISDGLYVKGFPHPRLYSTYPIFIGKYVKELKIMSLEEAIKRITSLPANRLGIKDIGTIENGKRADLTIFDYENYNSKATYTRPKIKPAGIKSVIISGNVVVKNGKFTGELFGEVLKN